jgi:2-oxoglutarate ferredoxin oxidoreductase subunit gamma
MTTSSGRDRIEVALSGSGGQGMILAGKILAEAVSIFDDKQAVMTQSYGPEARGGAARAEVIISDRPIHYPKMMNLNILLVMTQEALDKYGEMLQTGGLLVADETLVKAIPGNFQNVFKAPFSALAKDTLGSALVTNIISLGALAAVSQVVSRESLISAVAARVPEKYLALNRSALDLGYKVANDSGFRWKSERLET